MKVARPTSIVRDLPVRMMRAASLARTGMFSVRRKSPPVPLGNIANSTSLPEFRIPFATSEIVPSPPQAMINSLPFRAASPARFVASPRFSVKETSKDPKWVRRSLAIWGHALPVAPEADDGFRMTTGKVKILLCES